MQKQKKKKYKKEQQEKKFFITEFQYFTFRKYPEKEKPEFNNTFKKDNRVLFGFVQNFSKKNSLNNKLIQTT